MPFACSPHWLSAGVTTGVVAGVDFPIALGAHVRLASQLRFQGIHRASYGSGRGTKALSPKV